MVSLTAAGNREREARRRSQARKYLAASGLRTGPDHSGGYGRSWAHNATAERREEVSRDAREAHVSQACVARDHARRVKTDRLTALRHPPRGRGS